MEGVELEHLACLAPQHTRRLGEEPAHEAPARKDFSVRVVYRVPERGEAGRREAFDARS